MNYRKEKRIFVIFLLLVILAAILAFILIVLYFGVYNGDFPLNGYLGLLSGLYFYFFQGISMGISLIPFKTFGFGKGDKQKSADHGGRVIVIYWIFTIVGFPFSYFMTRYLKLSGKGAKKYPE